MPGICVFRGYKVNEKIPWWWTPSGFWDWVAPCLLEPKTLVSDLLVLLCFETVQKRQVDFIQRYICSNAEEGNSTHYFWEKESHCNKGHIWSFSVSFRATTLPDLLVCGQHGTVTPRSTGRASGWLPAPGTSLSKEFDCFFHLSKLWVRNIPHSQSLYWLKV